MRVSGLSRTLMRFFVWGMALVVTGSAFGDDSFYHESQLDKFGMDATKIIIPEEKKDLLASEMIEYLTTLPANEQIDASPRVVALTLFLAPKNRDAIILIGQLKRGHTPRKFKGIKRAA